MRLFRPEWTTLRGRQRAARWADTFRRDHLAADAQAAGRARSDFESWLHAHFTLPAASRVDLIMAVNEAVANAAEHAYFGSRFGEGSSVLRRNELAGRCSNKLDINSLMARTSMVNAPRPG